MKGNIKTFALTSILQLLSTDRKTGVLELKSQDNAVKIFFSDGTIVYAMGSRKESRIGHILRSRDLISEEQLREGLQLAQKRKHALGKVLVDKGYISIKTLKTILHQQVEDILLELFYWDEGDFEYEDMHINLKAMIVTQINIMSLILEASRRIDEISVLKKNIKSDSVVFRLSEQAQNATTKVKLNKDEWRILALVNGKRSVGQLIAASSLDRLSVYKILNSLLSYGYVKQVQKPVREKEAGSADLEAILTIYHETLQIIRKNLVAELGPKAYPLFESGKPGDTAELREMFNRYDISNPASTNIKAVVEFLGKSRDVDKATGSLVDGFDRYVDNVLKEAPIILEQDAVRELVTEIDRILPYFTNYITEDLKKYRILERLGESLARLERTLGHKQDLNGKQGSGFLSMFRR